MLLRGKWKEKEIEWKNVHVEKEDVKRLGNAKRENFTEGGGTRSSR